MNLKIEIGEDGVLRVLNRAQRGRTLDLNVAVNSNGELEAIGHPPDESAGTTNTVANPAEENGTETLKTDWEGIKKTVRQARLRISPKLGPEEINQRLRESRGD